MNLLFDLISAHPLMGEKVHGGSKYTKKIFSELLKSNVKGVQIFALFDSKQKFDVDIQSMMLGTSVILVDIRTHNIKEIIAENKIDRCYFALPYNIAFNFSDLFETNSEIIITIHGLRDLEVTPKFESLKYLKDWKERFKALLRLLLNGHLYKKKYNHHLMLLNKAKIITVSNHTKFALKAYFPKHTNEVLAFYSPDVTELANDNSDGNIEQFDESNYFLLVNGGRWLKNNLRAAMALDELFSEGREAGRKVIITGVSDNSLYARKIKNIHRFVFYDFVSENLLRTLYQNAYVFIYLSLNEGFGYPPLEAMKYGIPVIASPFTSIPEICENAVLYTNPYAIMEIKNRILQLEDIETYKKYRERGLRRYTEVNVVQEEHLSSLIKHLTS